jgi:hypothetical protein
MKEEARERSAAVAAVTRETNHLNLPRIKNFLRSQAFSLETR